MIKINKKQITLAVMLSAFACQVRAADDKALIAQAREFAHELAMCVNPQGSSLLKRLAERVEYLMPLQAQAQAQAERIDVLGAQVKESDKLRVAILNALGVHVPTAALLVSVADFANDQPQDFAAESHAAQEVLSSSSELNRAPVAPVISIARMRRIYYSGNPMQALAMGKAIIEDSQQTPSNRALAYELIGEIYSCSQRNFPLALETYDQALAIPDLPAKNRTKILSLIGDIHRHNKDLDKALEIYHAVFGVENGLTDDLQGQVFRNIQTITEELHPQAEVQELSNSFDQLASPSGLVSVDLADDAPELSTGLSVASNAPFGESSESVAKGSPSRRVKNLIYENQFVEALEAGKAILADSTQIPIERAVCLTCVGYIYRVGDNGVERNYGLALEHYNQALAMPELRVIYRATNLGDIGHIYRVGGNGVERNYDLALDHYNRALAMQELPAVERALCLAGVGCIYETGGDNARALKQYNLLLEIPELPEVYRAECLVRIGNLYRIGGNGVAQDLPLALDIYQTALAVENGLTVAEKTQINARIAEISATLRARQRPRLAPKFSSSAPSLSEQRHSRKRVERTASTSDLSGYASSPKRPRGGRPAKIEATHLCEICGTLYTSVRGLQLHESSITHRDNARLKKSLVQPSSANASTSIILSDDVDTESESENN